MHSLGKLHGHLPCLLPFNSPWFEIPGGFFVWGEKGFHFQCLLLRLKGTCSPEDVFCQKKAWWILLCLCFLFVLEGLLSVLLFGCDFLWGWVGAQIRSGSWLIVPVCSLFKSKISKCSTKWHNGSLGMSCLCNSFVELQQFPGRVDGNRREARGTAKHSTIQRS